MCEVSLAKPFWASSSPGVAFDADIERGLATTDADNCRAEGFAELQVLLRSGSQIPTAQWIARTLESSMKDFLPVKLPLKLQLLNCAVNWLVPISSLVRITRADGWL